jgi:hypothetical protein
MHSWRNDYRQGYISRFSFKLTIILGTSTLNQLEKIIELIGRPKPEDIEAIQAPLLNNVF